MEKLLTLSQERKEGTFSERFDLFKVLQYSHLVSSVFKQDNPVNGEIMQQRESSMFYFDKI